MNSKNESLSYTAFENDELLVTGKLEEVVLQIRKRLKSYPQANILMFNDETGKQMDFDVRGSEKEVLEKLKIYLSPHDTEESIGPGRPKLGVMAREVSLLPRHWEWLATQPGGASAALRKLVEEARKSTTARDSVKQSQERTYTFMTAKAGNFPNYEEALRALYAKDKIRFRSQISNWPQDVKDYIKKLSQQVFAN